MRAACYLSNPHSDAQRERARERDMAIRFRITSCAATTEKENKMEAEQEAAVRIGVMGCATIAKKVSRAIRLAPNARLVAVASRTAEKARRFAMENGFPEDARVCGSYEELLEDPAMDAVYMPLPTSLHRRWVPEAARRGKHILVEKPAALAARELEEMLVVCEDMGVQFMDGTMWMHHPRTAKMRELLSDASLFGDLRWVNSAFTFAATDYFLKNDIRVKPDLDALGALGDAGWYCIRSILWAADYELPKTVTAIRGTVSRNAAGVLLSCGSSLLWDDEKVATFHCSFNSNLTTNFTVSGTRGWSPLPTQLHVATDLPQEACLVREFARLVRAIIDSGSKPDQKWPVITKKTQMVLDAVKASIGKGYEPVSL
ncbi:uncharacterized oxidoreductase At4g09670-like isoform X3 [Nymphaea colorata]|uniref:uncharacterized oxidoreductase At4g09670-like isoform X3 n=1 Tax=Nymphaea colorata TaxID=210225 RepID=UPI00129EB0F1|nr:uncharacterized oxidoreductase At4g09670-like isoform X3 [Nymphaea colorata]